MYTDSAKGQPPVPPALLAMVTILQAADGVSDEGAVNEAAFDLRWQMVLDCMGAETAPFSQGSLVEFVVHPSFVDKQGLVFKRPEPRCL